MSNQELHSSPIHVGLLITLALLSGCCGLAYEILYMRSLTTLLGDMFYVHAALLSTFLVGIGLGAKLAHRWVRWLWAFEILTGLYALALPIVTKWFSQQTVMVLVTSSPLLTIFTTIALLSGPSLLIGFSIPLFSAYIKARRAERLAFQGIYRAYNFGAFLSIICVELIIIRCFGIKSSLAIVGMINLLNGIVLLLMKMAPTSLPTVNTRIFPRNIRVALALASLSSAVFQMFFLKLSYLVFRPHRENFAVALSITLLGIFLGTWLVSKTRIRFQTLLILIPVMIGLIYANYLPILQIYQKTSPWAHSSEFFVLIYKFAFGCIFALGPMILFGATIPALMRSENEVAGESGHLLWISSLANSAGYLAYVLIGHFMLPTHAVLALISGIAILASLLAAEFRWLPVHSAFAAIGVILVAFMAFQWQERNFYLANEIDRLKAGDNVTVFKSGAESATLVSSDELDWISYNGHPSIYIQQKGIVNRAEVISGVIPGLTAPRLERAMVLGMGTGITAGATSCIFEITDAVEINNAFFKMMPSLSFANLNIGRNPYARLHLADGRSFLVGKERSYDAIINSIPSPTYFSASKIYTVEFYERVARALKPDGVFCTWMSVAEMSEQGVQVVLSALRRSFRYCDLRLLRDNYYMATFSNQPVKSRRFSELNAKPELVEMLQKCLMSFDLDEYFEDIRISENLYDHFVPSIPKENTDDHPILEFMVVRSHQLDGMGQDFFLQQQDLLNIDAVRQHELEEPARLARRAAVFHQFGIAHFKQNFLPFLRNNQDSMSLLILWSADHLVRQNEFDEAVSLLTKALQNKPGFSEAYSKLASIFESQGKLDEAIKLYRRVLEIQPDFAEAHYNLGNALVSKGEENEAIGHYRRAVQLNPNFTEAHDKLVNLLGSK